MDSKKEIENVTSYKFEDGKSYKVYLKNSKYDENASEEAKQKLEEEKQKAEEDKKKTEENKKTEKGNNNSENGKNKTEAKMQAGAKTSNGFNFIDAPKDVWYYDAVYFVAKKGLMLGTSDNEFSPNVDTTRGMIVTILYRLAGGELSTTPNGFARDDNSRFKDVKQGAWYADGANWANQNGIVSGVGAGLFKPNDKLTREQLVTVMYRYAKYQKYDTDKSVELSNYSDLKDVSSYAVDAMKWAVANGIVNGTSKTTLAPKKGATRAEMAKIFMNFINK